MQIGGYVGSFPVGALCWGTSTTFSHIVPLDSQEARVQIGGYVGSSAGAHFLGHDHHFFSHRSTGYSGSSGADRWVRRFVSCRGTFFATSITFSHIVPLDSQEARVQIGWYVGSSAGAHFLGHEHHFFAHSSTGYSGSSGADRWVRRFVSCRRTFFSTSTTFFSHSST